MKIKLIYLLLFVYLIFILFYIHPLFLSNEIIAGWDTVTHISTLEKYPSEILKGNFIYNDPLWFNGYTAFQYYPPLFFIIISIIYLITFKLFSIIFILKVLLFIFILLFVLSLYFLFNKTFNLNKEISIILSIVSSFLWLFSNISFDYFGIGLSSVFYLGEFTNFIGVVIGVFLIVFADYYYKLKKKKLKHQVYFIFLLSSSLLTHVFSFLFFSLFVFVLFLRHSFKSKKQFLNNFLDSVGVIFSTLLLCSFWIYPILRYFSYSASINASYVYSITNIFYIFISGNFLFIFFLAFFFFGVYYLYKIKRFEYLFYFLFFLFFSIYFFRIPFGIHQYRFFAYVFLFYSVFISLGVYYSLSLIKKIKFNNIKKYYLIIFSIILIITFASAIYFVSTNAFGLRKGYHFTLDKYTSSNDSDVLLDILKEKDPKMVLAEQKIGLEGCISSPHYFEYVFTDNGIPSLLGLYTESTQTSIIYPFLNSFSENSRWFVKGYITKNVFNDFTDFVERLKMYNVDYVLASSNKFKYYLDNCNECNEFYSYFLCGTEYSLYSIDNSYSYFDAIDKKMFLFYSKKDSDWVNFSRMWFESALTYNYPLIRIKDPYLVSNFESDLISGIIINDLKEYNLFENVKSDILYSSSENSLILKSKNNLKFSDLLKGHDLNIDVHFKEINKDLFIIDIKSDKPVPVIIRKSFSPFWRAYDADGNNLEVYEYAPNFMLINSYGEISLEFKIPLVLKVLFVIFIIFFFYSSYLIVRGLLK